MSKDSLEIELVKSKLLFARTGDIKKHAVQSWLSKKIS